MKSSIAHIFGGSWLIIFLMMMVIQPNYSSPTSVLEVSIQEKVALYNNLNTEPLGPNFAKKLYLDQVKDKRLQSLIEKPENPFAPIDVYNDLVYFDKNEASHVYYYLPGSFSLIWDQNKGKYQFEITYPEDETGTKPVAIKARFAPSVIGELEYLLERMVYNITGVETVKVRPLNIPLGRKPKVYSNLSKIKIEEGSLAVDEFADYSKPMSISCTISQGNVESFVAAMAHDFKLDGNIELPISKDSSIQVSIHFSLLTPKTLGQFYYKNPSSLFLDGFQNKSSFPIKIKKIKVLNREKAGKVLFKEIPIYDGIVPPHTTRFDFSPAIRSEVRKYPANVLLEYEMLACEPCEQEAVRALLRGQVDDFDSWVEVWDLGAYDFTNARAIKLDIDKLYLKVDVEPQKSIKKAFEAPRSGNGRLDYTYRITIITQEGKILNSKKIHSQESSIYLNEDFIKKHFAEYRN